MHGQVSLSCCVVVALAGHASASSIELIPNYEVYHLGLSGEIYLDANDVRSEQISVLDLETRSAAGWTRDQSTSGFHAWHFNGQTSQRVGYFGAGFERDDGYAASFVYGVSGDRVIGISDTFSGSALAGRYAWLSDGGVMTRLGYTGAAHTRDDGYQSSFTRAMNGSGLVVGTSEKYNGSVWDGNSAWRYDLNTGQTIEIGLTGAQYASSTGAVSNTVDHLDRGGRVLGKVSVPLTTGGLGGGKVWLFDGAQTTEIGYEDATTTSTNGEIRQSASFSSAGQVLGGSLIYNGTTNVGNAAWVHDNGVTTRVGLTGGVFRGSDGRENSYFNSNYTRDGLLLGRSERYSGTLSIGQSAWIYDGTATTEIVRSESKYRRASDGYQFTRANGVLANGAIVGTSRDYSAGHQFFAGTEAWMLLDGGFTQIGVYGSAYIRADGIYTNTVEDIAANGLAVTGSVSLFSGSDFLGRDAWYYDVTTGITHQIEAQGRDGVRRLDVTSELSENGFMFGRYGIFTSEGESITHAYVFRPDIGFYDLNDLLLDGAAAAGFEYLSRAGFSAQDWNSIDAIFGYGRLLGENGDAAMFMVPAPGSLACLGALAAVRRRRR